MTNRHRAYLRSRRFDPDKLEAEWGLLGTGLVGPFAHRIIIPIYQEGKLVCFTARDISGMAKVRYKACPDTQAIVPIKNCVYGLDQVVGDAIIITEGTAKVWRFGPPAVATFGAIVSNAQLLQLKRFSNRIVMFDGDKTGKEQAHKLIDRLKMFPGTTSYCDLEDGVGPDDLSDEEAEEFVKHIKLSPEK